MCVKMKMTKTLTLTLTLLLINLASAAPARAAQDAAAPERIRAQVGRLGAGAQVNVKLTDGAKLKGQIGEADDEGFMLLDSKGGRTRLAYSQVESVKLFKKSHWKTFDPKGFAIGVGLIGGIFLVGVWAASQTR